MTVYVITKYVNYEGQDQSMYRKYIKIVNTIQDAFSEVKTEFDHEVQRESFTRCFCYPKKWIDQIIKSGGFTTSNIEYPYRVTITVDCVSSDKEIDLNYPDNILSFNDIFNEDDCS